MFDLLANSTKIRAIKKAIKELEIEQELAQLNEGGIKKEYQVETPQIEPATTYNKRITALRKAETTAVDLKNFKDWRKSSSVVSSNPKYKGNPFTKTDFDDDDEGDDFVNPFKDVRSSSDSLRQRGLLKPRTQKEDKKEDDQYELGREDQQPSDISDEEIKDINEEDTTIETKEEIKDSKPYREVGNVSLLSSLSSSSNYDRRAETFSQFEANRLKRQQSIKSLSALARQVVDTKVDQIQDDSLILSQKVKVEGENDSKIKIEVVAPDKTVTAVKEPVKANTEILKVKVAPIEPKKKNLVKRKPRGKNKYKFDADVITSVDWK